MTRSARSLALLSLFHACADPVQVGLHRTEFAITGGQVVAPGSHEGVVWLDGGCSGVLVHPSFVLFAGHCGAGHTTATFGEHAWIEFTDSGVPKTAISNRSIGLTDCQLHPNAALGSGADVGFCRLVEAVKDVSIVPVVSRCDRAAVAAGTPVLLVGFGFTQPQGGSAGDKRSVWSSIRQVPLVERGVLEFTIGNAEAGTCRGDSGGPAYVRASNGDDWALLAILSSGLAGECGVGWYTDVREILPWLEETSGAELAQYQVNCAPEAGVQNPSATAQPSTTCSLWGLRQEPGGPALLALATVLLWGSIRQRRAGF